MRLLTLLAILSLGTLLAAPVPKGAKKVTAIDGTWEMVERHPNGNRDDSAFPIRWTIEGESLVIEMLGKAGYRRVEGQTYQLVKPASGGANEIDYVLTPADGTTPPSTFRGRFELNGDTLKVCTSHSPDQNRPTECKPSTGTNLYVFKRAKDK